MRGTFHYPFITFGNMQADRLEYRTWGFGSRQTKRISPVGLGVRFSLRFYVTRIGQRSAKSRGFSPGARVSSHRES
jgi:hypothetical protein